jgi:hypothetical protein
MMSPVPADFQGTSGFAGIILQCTDDDNTFDMLMIRTADESATFSVDPFGYIGATGIDATNGGNVTLGRFNRSSGAGITHDSLASLVAGVGLRVGANGEIVLPGLPDSDPGVAGQLYTLAGVLNVSAG